MDTAQCYKCQKRKNKTEFHKDKGRSQGVCSVCKQCSKNRGQHKQYLREYARAYTISEKNQHKVIARKLMRQAINSGKLIRENCFCGGKGEGHHPDYSRPLDVVWLCDLHHQQLHRGIISHPSTPLTRYKRIKQ